MIVKEIRKIARNRVHSRIRKRLQGTSERPRLSVFKSNQHIYAQIIDDTKGITLVSSSTLSPSMKAELESGNTIEAAMKIGADIAKKALEKGISKVVYDRGGFLYHGKIKALADSARENGLEF